MRYTVQYIPLNKIKQEGSITRSSPRKKELKKVAQDLMQLLIVHKSRKDGGYIIQEGHQHFNFIKKHTNKNRAICLVEESKLANNVGNWVNRFRKRELPYEVTYLKRERIEVNSWKIIRQFLKREPRFQKLYHHHLKNIQTSLFGENFKFLSNSAPSSFVSIGGHTLCF